MDYIFFSSIAGSTLKSINMLYDIARQWYKKVWTHMKSLPTDLQFDSTMKMTHFFIPKFHLAAHIKTCQTCFSFNWTPGVGHTDGKAPEHGWANINHVATSMKEMGPGSQRDVLNDHFGNVNWKKKSLSVTLSLYICCPRIS